MRLVRPHTRTRVTREWRWYTARPFLYAVCAASITFTIIAYVNPDAIAPQPPSTVYEASPVEQHTAKSADNEHIPEPPPAPAPSPEPEPSPEPAPAPAAPPAPQGCDWDTEYHNATAGQPGTWTVEDQGAWGRTYPDTGQVYIAPRTPCDLVRSVVLHETCHVKQGQIYGGLNPAIAALEPYGGVEVNADACARHTGATWTNYASSFTDAQMAAGIATANGTAA